MAAGSYLRDLVRLLGLGGEDWLSVLSAYLEESGVGESPSSITPLGFVFATAGFVGPAEDWATFSDKWISKLRKEGLPDPPHFHMKDFLHARGDFSGWDEDRKERVLGELIDIINAHPLMGYGYAIIRGRPEEWTGPIELALGGAYIPVGYANAIRGICEFAAPALLGSEERIAFICARTAHPGTIMALYEAYKGSETIKFRNRLGALAFDTPKNQPALQAGDLLAYELRRKTIDEITGMMPRRSLVRLESMGRITYERVDKALLDPIWTKALSDPSLKEKQAELEKLIPKSLRSKRSTRKGRRKGKRL